MKFQRIQSPNPRNSVEQIDLIELYAASGEFDALQNVGAYISNDAIYYNAVDNLGSYTGQVKLAGKFMQGGKVPMHQGGGPMTPPINPNSAASQGAPSPDMSAGQPPMATGAPMTPASAGLEPEAQTQESKKLWDLLPKNMQELYITFQNTGEESKKKALFESFLAMLNAEVPQFSKTKI